mgnify:CR=1 FL=1
MTEVIVLQCDNCESLVDEDVVRTTDTTIAKCAICDKHYCNYCAEEHAEDETALVWRKR